MVQKLEVTVAARKKDLAEVTQEMAVAENLRKKENESYVQERTTNIQSVQQLENAIKILQQHALVASRSMLLQQSAGRSDLYYTPE